PVTRQLIEENRSAIERDRAANVETIKFVEASLSKLPGARATARFDVHVIYEKKIDLAAERERLKTELEKTEKEKGNNQRQLSNANFLAKAPVPVVEGLRRRGGELDVLLAKLK